MKNKWLRLILLFFKMFLFPLQAHQTVSYRPVLADYLVILWLDKNRKKEKRGGKSTFERHMIFTKIIKQSLILRLMFYLLALKIYHFQKFSFHLRKAGENILHQLLTETLLKWTATSSIERNSWFSLIRFFINANIFTFARHLFIYK